MRRIDPAFPDLLPLSHRLGPVPAPADEAGVTLDPVEMRLVHGGGARLRTASDRSVPRRPVRLLVHAATASHELVFISELLRTGCGVALVLDTELAPERFPAPAFPAQVVVLAPWLPELWGGKALPQLTGWRDRGVTAGVLLALGPSLDPQREVEAGVGAAAEAGAAFIVASPLAVPPEDRHRIYDRHAGEAGDGTLENLLFHTDLGALGVELERAASRASRRLGLPEWLLGPATSLVGREPFVAAAKLLLWARRLDLLEGVGSAGWQLRRAAQALLASRRDPQALVAEDNLRVVPGFNPWVEAFARAAWSGSGEPFESVLARWLAE
ncbi:MAG: hypothetical protein ACHQHM_05085 [Thermoanaerobaculales bacterium]